ncbi:phage tail length tape measure family protein [Mesorhizobium sp.]|uniref:phage tail length tape measure family protein n=1 Tax=Mesorhizobium sp. TaxID=1871066 RepID=UPI00257E6312|nr:phage tail length tape measure family protein [Mesorhizobium sp.]
MTIQLSRLVTSAEIDASKYKAGADQKVASDQAMVASARAVGDAVAASDTKIGTSGNVVSILTRRYVEGQKEAQAFERDLRGLNRQLETGKLSVEQAATILVGMNQKLGMNANASELAAKGQTQLAAAVGAANAQIEGQASALAHADAAQRAMITQARADQQAENSRQIAASNQGKFNTILGVATAPSANARASASVFEAEFARLEETARLRAQQAGSVFADQFNASVMTNSGKSARASASVFEESGREADLMAAKVAALRAELNPLAAAQDRVNAEMAEYAALAARGAISADELAQAQAMARGRSAANQNAYKGVNQFSTGNIAAQFQDIAVTSAMGMSPLQIALQQGTQLSAVLGPMGAAGAAKSLGSALLSIVNPTSLIVLGIVGATAATVQWFAKGREGAKTMDDAIKLHSENLKLLKEEYGDLGEAVKSVGSIGGQAFTSAQVRGNQAILDAMLRDKAGPFLEQLSGTSWTQSLFGNGGGIAGLRDLPGGQAQFAAPIDALIKSAREGKTDLASFDDEVERLFQKLLPAASDPTALRNTADAILLLGDNAFSVTGKFAPFADAINRLKVEAADGAPEVYQFNQEIERIGQTNGLQKLADEAIIAGKEIVDLARQAEELEKILARVDRENTRPGLSDLRSFGRYVAVRDATLRRENDQFEAEQQMARARTNAEKLAAIEAQVRARAAEDGDKGGGLQGRVNRALEAERNRQAIEARDAQVARGLAIDKTLAGQQLDLTLIGKTAGEAAKLRMEFEQIAAIREEAAEKGIAADESEIAAIKAKAEAYGKFADEIARANLARELSFERDQMFRSAQDQQIASRQQGAGLAVDLNSPAAQQMRDLARFADAKGLAVGFLTDFKSELLSNGGDVGKALGESILNALTTSMDKQLSDIFDRLGTWIAAALTGQRPGAGLGGGTGFAANTTLSAFLGASNDNYAPGAVTRSPLAAVGAGSGSMAAYASAIRSIESAGSGGYSALGPWTRGDRAYGAYQVMGNNIPSWSQDALGKSLTPSQFLADPAAQDAIFKNQFGKYLSKYGNPQDAASAWFTGGPLKTGAGARDVLGTSGSAYVDKFNAAVQKATEGLGGLDSTVTNTVQSLAGGLGGKGGLASILEGLKPGNFQANTSLSEVLGYAGSAPAPTGGGGGIFSALLSFIPKLFGFANGTDFAPGGLARINEMGGEIVDLPRGSRVIPHDVSMRMAANANRPSQPSKVDFNINLVGANGDEHVRMLAKQGAQEAIGQYHEAQSRGGFGELQRQYASQKG